MLFNVSLYTQKAVRGAKCAWFDNAMVLFRVLRAFFQFGLTTVVGKPMDKEENRGTSVDTQIGATMT